MPANNFTFSTNQVAMVFGRMKIVTRISASIMRGIHTEADCILVNNELKNIENLLRWTEPSFRH